MTLDGIPLMPRLLWRFSEGNTLMAHDHDPAFLANLPPRSSARPAWPLFTLIGQQGTFFCLQTAYLTQNKTNRQCISWISLNKASVKTEDKTWEELIHHFLIQLNCLLFLGKKWTVGNEKYRKVVKINLLLQQCAINYPL